MPATLAALPVQLTLGDHGETIVFVVTPGMACPLILGMARLAKWNPAVDWRTAELRFPKGDLDKAPARP